MSILSGSNTVEIVGLKLTQRTYTDKALWAAIRNAMQPAIKKIASEAQKNEFTTECLSGTRLPFGQYDGVEFDKVPLQYLDWLSGQDWVYGKLRNRLTAYLSHPTMQRELDLQFIDPDLERIKGHDRNGFPIPDEWSPDQTAPSNQTPWHGQPMPNPKPPIFIKYEKTYFTQQDSWDLLADIHIAIDQAEDVSDTPEWNEKACQWMRKHVPETQIQKLTMKYQAKRDRLNLLAMLPPWKREAAYELLTVVDLRPDLEPIARSEGGEVWEAAELIRIQSIPTNEKPTKYASCKICGSHDIGYNHTGDIQCFDCVETNIST